MNLRTWAITLASCLLALTATAQDAARTFRDSTLKHQLYLRGFGIDTHVRGHWDTATNTLMMDTPTTHALAVFTPKSVKVKGAKIEIKGVSQALVRGKADQVSLLANTSDIEIQIDLRGADLNTVLPTLPSLLFYADQAEALAALPKRYKTVLPLTAGEKCCGNHLKTNPQARSCDCNDPKPGPCTESAPGTPTRVMPPRVIHTVDPEFSEKARQFKLNANIQVALKVDTAGNPVDIWILSPVGMDLDAKAGEAVSQYRFAPATCGGKPIAISLYIDVNFQIF